MENIFVKPEKPFMVSDHFEGEDCEMRVNWFETEEDAKEFIKGYRHDFSVIYVLDYFIEIGSSRDIEF